jgi:16S rRNA (guanine527-N7)-methyltransferase
MSNIDEEGDKAVSLPIFTGNRLELDQRLRETASALQIDVPNECWGPIADYCSELWDWNTRVNLTRHTTPELFVKRDLLDSWHVCKLLEQNEEVLDVGTGSGVPGILIAILRPDTQVTLCDSVAKKAKSSSKSPISSS